MLVAPLKKFLFTLIPNTSCGPFCCLNLWSDFQLNIESYPALLFPVIGSEKSHHPLKQSDATIWLLTYFCASCSLPVMFRLAVIGYCIDCVFLFYDT